MVAEYAGLGVLRHQDGAEILDARGIVGHEFFPEGALTRLDIQAVNSRGKLSWLVDVESDGPSVLNVIGCSPGLQSR